MNMPLTVVGYVKKAIFVAISLTLFGCVTNDPTKLSFKQNNTQSLLLMEMDPVAGEYGMGIASFDESSNFVTLSLTGGTGAYFKKSDKSNYAYAVISPGSYTFTEFVQQDSWALCFHAHTVSFTVEPGQSLFLGHLQTRTHLAQLQQMVSLFGPSSVRQGDHVYYRDGILPPRIATPSAADVGRAQQYILESMPKVQATLAPVLYRSAKFDVGHDIFGNMLCLGYGRKPLPNS
ncbi:hypothetical protein [Nitrospirillum iridis]|uniref:Uncharacterized protein n=1 Tax=Nitrospirillum iridis TaxID=765888 RepID=A0A7X0AYB5_9PROT|nr:hypothetical protein [Nitrospirillum iridis]MBB6250926.1 hypothetical protein [Nitrospirillum iridis]